MTSLREFLPGPKHESLADRVERLTGIMQTVRPETRATFRKEVREWLNHPNSARLATSLVGNLQMKESAPVIHERLQTLNLPASQYNTYVLALGQLGHEPAAQYIAEHLAFGQTRAAAAYALLLIDPERAAPVFKEYARENRREAAMVAGVGLLEQYMQNGINGMDRRAKAIPKNVLRSIARYVALPAELQHFLKTQTRRI